MPNYAAGLNGALSLGAPAADSLHYAGSRLAPYITDTWMRPNQLMGLFYQNPTLSLPIDGYVTLAGVTVPYFVADTPSKLAIAYKWAVQHRALSLDTETSDRRGIYTPEFKLRTVQLASEHAVVYIPYTSASHAQLESIFRKVEGWLIHNASFDLPVLDRFELASLDDMWPKTVDSMLYAQLVQHPRTRAGDGSFPAKLKELVRKLVDPEYGDDKILRQRMAQGDRVWVPQKKDPTKGRWARGPVPWTWGTVPVMLEEFVRYAVCDPWMTLLVFKQLLTVGRAQDEELYDYEARNAWLMCRAAKRGLLVDTANANRMIQQFDERLVEIDGLFEANDLDSESPDTHENKWRFVEVMAKRGVRLDKRTKEGLPALDAGTILAAAESAGLTEDALLLAWSDLHQMEKYRSAYVEPFLMAARGDGRVHPSIRTLGARTGRMSISDPPLQQLPRIGDVRSCLRADEGHVLVGADYSAIEMAVAAALSGDRRMQELIANGVDIHGVVAESVFGPGFSKEQRNVAKRAGLGRLYGAGAKTVARQCGVPVVVAAKALTAFDKEFPELKRYAAWVAEDSDLITFTGRRVRADPTRPYANINYVVQSSARDVFMLGGLRAAGAGLESYLWLPMHDEWIVQAPDVANQPAMVGTVLEQALASSLRGVQFKAAAEIIGTHWHK